MEHTEAAYVESGSRSCEVLRLRESLRPGKDVGGLAFLIRVPAKFLPASLGVPKDVPKLPNEVTLGGFSSSGATLNDWDCVASRRSRELLNRYTGGFDPSHAQMDYGFCRLCRMRKNQKPWAICAATVQRADNSLSPLV